MTWWMWVLAVLILVTAVYYVNNILHFRYNRRSSPGGDFIFNQSGEKTGKLRYGFFRTSYNGCGWIAVYNAARLLGENPQAEKVISYLERWGLVLFGVFGTFPPAAASYFRRAGYRVSITFSPEKFDRAAKAGTANIVWFFHKRGAHFVTLKWDGSNFIGYNTYSNSTSPDNWGKSIRDNLKRRNKKPVLLISVSKKDNGKNADC